MVHKRKILVTGGAGFLGSHLCEKLLALGSEVICMDNFHTGSQKHIQHLLSHPHFELISHDVCTPIHLEIDAIYNLACPASPLHYQSDPVKTVKTCVHGMINMLDLARSRGCPIFQASTSEVYGDPSVHPQDESYWGSVNPIGPRSCYDEGKRCAETLCFDYHRQYGVEIKVGRIFNTFGPRLAPQDGRVVSNFILQALSSLPITLYGDGSQTRSFCYVEDLIEGIVALMEAPPSVTGPINLGNPHECSILELAKKITQLTRSASAIELCPLPQDDPKQRCPDIRRAQEILGWTPKISLEEGLKKTIAYFMPAPL